jgi:ribosomal protein S18 acetylase RimI-like enzyme
MHRAELVHDAAATAENEASVRDIIRGHFSHVRTALILSDTDEAIGFTAVHSDDTRQRHYPDFYLAPGALIHDETLTLTMELAKDISPDWELWLGINSQDSLVKAVLEARGYEKLRIYWSMHRPLGEERFPTLPAGYTIENITTDDQLRECHSVHQDAFSSHFGFAPRPFEAWRELVLNNEANDPHGTFLLRDENGLAIGFVETSHEKKHMNGGYVDTVGVRHACHGKGLGKILLQWAIAYSRQQNFDFIELNVDTGNVTNALKLYEGLGFTPRSSWEQWHNPHWAKA